MGLKEIVTSCIGGSKESQEEYYVLDQEKDVEPNVFSGLGHKNQEIESSNYYDLVKKIQQGEITLEVLENLRKLKVDDKKSFLADAEETVSNNRLHELNKKIMEHAQDLSAPDDLTFFLRRPAEDSIFRELLYLGAKGNKFTAEIDKEGTLTINFSSRVLELYKPIINNLYLKKFKNDEFQAKIYKLYKEDLEKLGDVSEIALENYYIKKSLAQSIMCLFVSRDIREHDVCEELFESEAFKKVRELEKFKALRVLSNYNEDAKARFNSTIVDDVLNDVNGIYINNLTHSNILNLIMYSSSNNETIESIEILGNSESLV